MFVTQLFPEETCFAIVAMLTGWPIMPRLLGAAMIAVVGVAMIAVIRVGVTTVWPSSVTVVRLGRVIPSNSSRARFQVFVITQTRLGQI